MRRRLILVVFGVLLLGVGALVFWGQHRQRSAERYYSGTIEADRADLAFQVSGRVAEVAVDEGQLVKKGQALARLDPQAFSARREQALAALGQANESLHQAETLLELSRHTLPAEVERAEAAAETLKFQFAEVVSGSRQQEIARARLAVESAGVVLEDAQRDRARFDALFQNKVVSAREKENVDSRYETAAREHARALETLRLLEEGSRKTSIDAARSRLAEARAAVTLAQNNLKRIDAAEKEVLAARARVRAAEAAFKLAEIELAYATLFSPLDGVVVSRNVEPGEVVSPGQEVLGISDLSRVDLVLFVGEEEIGGVVTGQRAEVRIDTFPDKTYPGRVSYISPEAEFTPKMIQTHKERVKLVYRVKVAIDNPDRELKSGMPADAYIR